ncbi:hypothetical protein SAMN04487989_10711 [Bizionia echini]|uniref:Uncharacterized protein n=1 Tax=Bizionia echini TaxID=649333 RepID=A0A1I5D603_9FLAO|nr:hypothetical protein [Bizionia echini]SFN94655.1 hypothetical protein SAMN04487989_10711 [Bizionia echini]|tara:strand:+ start:188 stop:478 length:291 start_codon:yes stop_codon:yes gene_type:complete
MTVQIKRKIISVVITMILLAIPLVAMQFTTEVNWKLSDFIVAGILVLGTLLMTDYILQKTKRKNIRIGLIGLMILIFITVFIELAVGILGTPFAGN